MERWRITVAFNPPGMNMNSQRGYGAQIGHGTKADMLLNKYAGLMKFPCNISKHNQFFPSNACAQRSVDTLGDTLAVWALMNLWSLAPPPHHCDPCLWGIPPRYVIMPLDCQLLIEARRRGVNRTLWNAEAQLQVLCHAANTANASIAWLRVAIVPWLRLLGALCERLCSLSGGYLWAVWRCRGIFRSGNTCRPSVCDIQIMLVCLGRRYSTRCKRGMACPPRIRGSRGLWDASTLPLLCAGCNRLSAPVLLSWIAML